ncbi:MAG: helix-turn-helix domain-containing protein [Planctomycetota bacterium]|jgi:transposase
MEMIHANIGEDCAAGRNAGRERVELLRNRVGLLRGKDRLLMTMYLENGNSVRQLAQLAGVSEGSIGRRIRKLSRRLLEGEYVMCLRRREEFTKAEMEIAREHFLRGVPQMKIAAKRGWTYYRVRKTVMRIRQILGTGDGV